MCRKNLHSFRFIRTTFIRIASLRFDILKSVSRKIFMLAEKIDHEIEEKRSQEEF